jgi:chromosomal replication initiator protein
MLQVQAEAVLGQIKEQLAQHLSRSKYELLIRPLRVVDLDEQRLVLSTTNDLLRGWLLDQYGELVADVASMALGHQVELQVVVFAGEQAVFQPEPLAPALPENITQQDLGGFNLSRHNRPLLNPRYTFEQFAVGPGNQFAFSAAQQVALRPGTAYNPLLIYGNAGLGKTHLLHAIGHACFAAQPQANVVYATAEKFTNDYIEHVRTGRMPQLHARYRAADLLLIDDVQFVAGKAETAGELFHTILQLIEAGKQVAVAADKPPRLLKGLDERLASRLSAGLVCDLSAPALETRIAILERKAALEQVSLPADVARFIAERATESVRQLEGALIRLLAFCDFSSSAPSVELASRVLTDLLEGQVSTQLSIQQIMKAAGEHFNVSEQLLLSPNRSKRVALARMVVMYLARQYTNLTLSQIGAELGGRDHSTVSHGAGKIAADIGSDPFVEQAVAQITRMLK